MRREAGRSGLVAAAFAALIATGAVARAGDPAPTPLAPRSGEAGAVERLYSPAALHRFFAALSALDRHRTRAPVRIIQIGDSHTANDTLSGRMRELLQRRFGDAGRGWLPAGVPYKYYRPHLVTVAELGWRQLKAGDAGAVPLGLDAAVAQSMPPAARMTLAASAGDAFDHVAVEFIARPDGAPLSIRADQRLIAQVRTSAPRDRVRRVHYRLPHPVQELEVAALGSGSATLLGWAAERSRPGIIYENHGTIGATAALLAAMDPDTVAFELADRRPALLIVAFGTNEGFKDTLDLHHYAARFEADVAGLAARAPRASILIIGPPDGNRRGAGCAARPDKSPDECVEAGDRTNCVWREPVHLAAVRHVQQRIAARRGWAFWDWSAAMGGACSMDRLSRRDPPLAFPDHVHLNKNGYVAIADMLYGDLMRAYAAAEPRGRKQR
jgi:lysophospholipase L1-like esterase